MVDAQTVLPPDWIAMCEAVQHQPGDAARMDCLEAFLEPRWQACRPAQALQVQRVMQRSGLSAAEVLAIIGQQASRAARLVAANDVLVNAGPLTQLAPRAARLHGQYLRLAKGHAAATAGAL